MQQDLRFYPSQLRTDRTHQRQVSPAGSDDCAVLLEGSFLRFSSKNRDMTEQINTECMICTSVSISSIMIRVHTLHQLKLYVQYIPIHD